MGLEYLLFKPREGLLRYYCLYIYGSCLALPIETCTLLLIFARFSGKQVKKTKDLNKDDIRV